jgi:hypothetical protein
VNIREVGRFEGEPVHEIQLCNSAGEKSRARQASLIHAAIASDYGALMLDGQLNETMGFFALGVGNRQAVGASV